jgi:hypothetical protein
MASVPSAERERGIEKTDELRRLKSALNRKFESISLHRRVGCELPGDGNQVDREAFVDQKPHDTAMVSRPRRVR